MKVLCDVHISHKVVRFFEEQGVEAVHVNQILNGSSSTDRDICTFADAHNFVVVTKDVDFRNSYFLHKSPKKLIRICLGNIPNQNLIKLLSQHLPLLQSLAGTTRFYLELNQLGVMLMSDE